jgi:MobA/VirD2-like, nuclease domain
MTRRNRFGGAFRECTRSVPLIGKVLRGTRVAGLIWYLYGPGQREEHTDPHLVAGWRDPAELEPAIRADGTRDFRRINGLLNQPLAALGRLGFDKPVWHCVARAASGDPVLSDSQWAWVAEQIMHRTELARVGDDEAVRWVAVRHAPDHVHIVVTLARQDGTKPRIWNDFYRVREACMAVERRYGLHVTAPGDRTAGRRPTRAENEHARRRGWEEPARTMLRRAVHTAAAGASSEREFFTRLETAGLLVRKRFSQRDPSQVTGYAVAKPGHVNRQGAPVWFGGGKLAPDLTLPKLRHRWLSTGSTSTPHARLGARLSGEERRRIWNGASDTAARATNTIRSCAFTDPAAAADAAWAASDALHVAADVLGSRTLGRAADSYARAARCGYGRIPRPTPAGDRLRVAARLLALAATAGDEDQAAVMMLVAKLAELAIAVAELRDAQRHAAQASAARVAAERLHTATCAGSAWARPANPEPTVRAHRRARTAADLAGLDFPFGAKLPRTAQPGSPRQGPAQPPTPRRASQPRRPRGPSP